MNKDKLIPELRFPEFKNEGEWEEKQLMKLANRVLDKNRDSAISSVFTNSAVHGIVDQREFFDKDIANKSNLENYYVVEDGDYVYNPRISNEAPVGPISKNKTGCIGVMSPLYTVFRFKNNENQFYEYYFISRHWYIAIRKAANTGARFDRMSITDSVFMGIPILFPSPQEQQKIASCLSSLDEVIAAETQYLATLQDHKKGLMQNLFPTNSITNEKTITNYESSITSEKTITNDQLRITEDNDQVVIRNLQTRNLPKVRFKEFEKDGDWIEKKLGELTLKVGSGSTPLGGEAVYKKTGRPFVRSQNVSWGVFLLENIAFIDEPTHQNSINTEIQIEDVLLNITGASIGRSAVANEFLSGGNVNQHVCIIRTKKDILNPFFLNQFLISDFGQKQIDSFQAGGNRQGLNFVQIRSLSIHIPPTIQEQQKIASCLSSLDALITAQAEKIEQLQQHKKGLMQGLFPKTITN